MSVSFPVELDREDDGRWIAEIPDLPGVLCYGTPRMREADHGRRVRLKSSPTPRRVGRRFMSGVRYAMNHLTPSDRCRPQRHTRRRRQTGSRCALGVYGDRRCPWRSSLSAWSRLPERHSAVIHARGQVDVFQLAHGPPNDVWGQPCGSSRREQVSSAPVREGLDHHRRIASRDAVNTSWHFRYAIRPGAGSERRRRRVHCARRGKLSHWF